MKNAKIDTPAARAPGSTFTIRNADTGELLWPPQILHERDPETEQLGPKEILEPAAFNALPDELRAICHSSKWYRTKHAARRAAGRYLERFNKTGRFEPH